MPNQKKVIVIGAGFSGLSCATHLAQQGYDVTILEKNDSPGGRARQFKAEGFTFDMGPSWYWMPDVFERYFEDFGKKRSDYYDLVRLDPSYSVFFGENDVWNIPAKMSELEDFFEKVEPGSAAHLREFLKEAEYKYTAGIGDFVMKPSQSIAEFMDLKLLMSLFRLDMFTSMATHLRKRFKNPKLLQLLEFPVLFLGATAAKTPALYSMLNHADINLGTWYPPGGMYEIIRAMEKLALEKGVKIRYSSEVNGVTVGADNSISSVSTAADNFPADVVIAGADYQFIDQQVLPEKYRHYSAEYWDKRVMAPSCLLFYLGLNKKLDNLHHHSLFFDEDFDVHTHEIYEDPKMPSSPLFYVCAPSVTDPTVAPENCENIFVLIPLAPGLDDPDDGWRDKYYEMVMERMEKLTGQSIRDAVIYKRSYALQDFKSDYHAFKGNAYGLANTLMQTAFLKPKIKNKHLKNLYYTGQLTVPGPGMPPSLISGKVAAGLVIKEHAQ